VSALEHHAHRGGWRQRLGITFPVQAQNQREKHGGVQREGDRDTAAEPAPVPAFALPQAVFDNE
jgi:hypothetical protein